MNNQVNIVTPTEPVKRTQSEQAEVEFAYACRTWLPLMDEETRRRVVSGLQQKPGEAS